MSVKEKLELDLTDYEQVALEIRDNQRDNERDCQRDKKIAINMLNENSKIEFVSKVTGLSIEEVEELNRNLK